MNHLHFRWPSNATYTLLAYLVLFTNAFGQQAKQPIASFPAHTGPGGTSEYWDILPLSANTLHPVPPELGETDKLPKFTRELWRVEWRFGDPVDLYVIRPVGVEKPPVALYLYSYPTDTDRFRDDKLCETLTKNGFAAVGFVSALTGQRYHDRPMKEWFVSELQESLGTSVHDVQMVLNYLETRDDLDMKRVGIFGQGSGGTIAILAAAVDKRIKAVDVLDPWGDWPVWLAKSPQVPDQERARYLTPEFLASVKPLDPMQWMSKLNTRPFRMQETMFTSITPEAAQAQLVQSLPQHAVYVKYKTEDDYVKNASVGGKILEWMQQQLTAMRP